MAQQIPCPRLTGNPRAEDYEFFQRQLTSYFEIAEITNDSKRLQILLYSLGRDGLNVFDGLKEPKDTYENAILRLKEFFNGRSSILLRRKDFYQTRQLPTETVTEFSCKLRRLGKECEFGANLHTMLRDIFVIGVKDNTLGERLLSEDSSTLTFEAALQKAEAFERARSERRTVVAPQPITVGAVHSGPIAKQPQPVCYRCGSTSHKANHASCPASSAQCRTCGKQGHFAKVCRSSSSKPNAKRAATPNLNKVGANAISTQLENTTNDNEGEATFHIFYNETDTNTGWFREGMLNGRPTRALIDTGAEVNVLPRHLLPGDCVVHASPAKLQAYGKHFLTVFGETECEVHFNNERVHANFLVVDALNDFALFTGDLCMSLKLLPPVSLSMHANNIGQEATDCNVYDFLSDLEDRGIFKGVGNVHNFEYKIDIDSSVRPVASAARRLPPAILPEVEKVTDKLLSDGVIKRVEKATDWCSPIVIARKPNGSIRMCTDLRNLNRAVLRPLYQIPSIDDVLSTVRGSEVFSKLDCNSAFHQIRIAEESQELLTFITPQGRFCWTRLPYGISSAPEVFQMLLDGLLKGIPGVSVYYDDVLIATSDEQEHQRVLKRVFEVLLSAGITLNKEKCQFSLRSIQFLGHVITKDGIQPSPEKVQAIKKMPRPQNQEQLRSFLGSANWIGQRFISHYSTLVAPFWSLLKKGTAFIWTDQHSLAFENLKLALENVSTFACFNPSKDLH